MIGGDPSYIHTFQLTTILVNHHFCELLIPGQPQGVTIMFLYNLDHQVVVCHLWKFCIVPGHQSFEHHLWVDPHQLLEAELKASVELLLSYRFKTADELKEMKPKTVKQLMV